MVLKLSLLNSLPKFMSIYQNSDSGGHFEKFDDVIPSALTALSYNLSIPSTKKSFILS